VRGTKGFDKPANPHTLRGRPCEQRPSIGEGPVRTGTRHDRVRRCVRRANRRASRSTRRALQGEQDLADPANLENRGAAGADSSTGDGAGIRCRSQDGVTPGRV